LNASGHGRAVVGLEHDEQRQHDPATLAQACGQDHHLRHASNRGHPDGVSSRLAGEARVRSERRADGTSVSPTRPRSVGSIPCRRTVSDIDDDSSYGAQLAGQCIGTRSHAGAGGNDHGPDLTGQLTCSLGPIMSSRGEGGCDEAQRCRSSGGQPSQARVGVRAGATHLGGKCRERGPHAFGLFEEIEKL
jgi:hypothetical protein